MADLIDPDELIGGAEAAGIIGLTNRLGVAVYRKRYSDFPAAVIERGGCVLWLRKDIEAWAKGRVR